MKAIGLALCAISLIAGVIVGRADHEKAAASRRQPRASLEFPPDAFSPDPEPAPGRAARRARNVRDPVDDAETDASSERRASSQDAPAAISTVSGPEPPALASRLRSLEDLFARHDFEAVAAGAAILADETRHPALRDRALTLAAKSRVFQRIAAQLPAANTATASTAAPAPKRKLHEVHLANGNRIEVVDVKDEGERHVFQLAGGGVYAPRKEDVLKVVALSGEVAVAPGWADIERKIARIDDSILLYVEGVERAASLGFRAQAFQVLERLMARADSDKVPLLFVAGADEAFVNDWRVASGRAAPSRREVTADSVAASRLPERRAAGDDGESGEEAEAERPISAADADPLVAQATAIFNEARALYQSAAGKEGRGGDLEKAKERIHAALDLVQGVAAHPDARALRLKLGQLLSDVIRSSPLF